MNPVNSTPGIKIMSVLSSSDSLNVSDAEASHNELKRDFEYFKLSYDNLRQEAYSASLELKVMKKANAELSSELIAVGNENDALRAKQERLSHQHHTEIRNLQSAIEQLRAENADMQQCIETLSEQLSKSKSEARIETVTIEKPYDSIQHLDEIKKLNAKLMESESKLYELQQARTALSDECERLTERCDALQSDYENAKHEKEELQNLLDASQEQWRTVSAEMQELRYNPDCTQKGNSLFAEVDDQRKKLINIMKSNNARYYTLKAEHQKCPQRIQCLQNELTHLNSRVKLYEDSVGCADKSYVTAIQQQNKHVMDELQKEIDRNNFLQQQLANNSDAWVKSLVKYNLEKLNALRSRLMNCLLNQRLAEDEHLWRAQELEHVRSELIRLKLKSCNEHFDTLIKCDRPSSGKQDEISYNAKVSLLQECVKPLVNSNPELNKLQCSLETAICHSTAGGSMNGEVPLEKTTTEAAASNQENSEGIPNVAQSINHESQHGTKIEMNTTAKTLVIKRIQLVAKSSADNE